jgi:transposase
LGENHTAELVAANFTEISTSIESSYYFITNTNTSKYVISNNHVLISLNHHTEQQLKALSNKVKDHRIRMRLLAVAHFKAGINKADVARMLNVSRRMVNEWVANYFKGGVSALESKEPSGRPSLLSSQQKAELIDYIEKQSQSASGGRLNGGMLQTYIQHAFSISYHQNSIYKLLKSLNITWTTSRSKHPKQSEEAQENFKKTAN